MLEDNSRDNEIWNPADQAPDSASQTPVPETQPPESRPQTPASDQQSAGTGNQASANAPAAPADDLPRPPSGRRSKTRPAGPPQIAASKKTDPKALASKGSEPKAIESVTTAPTGRETESGVALPATSNSPAGIDMPVFSHAEQNRAATAAADTEKQDKPAQKRASAKKKTNPDKPARTRSRRSASASSADTSDASSAADTTDADAAAEQPQGEIPGLNRESVSSTADDAKTAGSPEPSSEATKEPKGAAPKPSRRRTSRKQTGTSQDGEGLDVSDIEAALAAAETAASRRSRSEKAADGDVDRAQALASLAAAIAGQPEDDDLREKAVEQAAKQTDSKAGKANRHDTVVEAAEDEAEDAVAGLVEGESAPGDAGHPEKPGTSSETTVTVEVTEKTEVSVEETENTDDEQGTSGRRRRRRGGRRRRKSSGSDDESGENTEDEQGDHDESKHAEHGESSTKSDEDKHGDESGEGSGSSNRRRRRRRRHSDDSADGDVAVRVREPKRASDEVAGIEGSTRLEAKKQRRREGRAAGRHRAPILTEAEFLARRESVERVMMVRQREDYTQLAVLEDNVLVEHYVDRRSSTSLIGNIYLGRVQNVLPSMEAVFIDIGRGRNAVLYAGEVDWNAYDVNSDRRKVEQVFKSGQTVLVQVSKDPVGAKGARLTGHVSIPGRYVVYSPGGHLSGISRKLPDSERHRLKKILDRVVGEESSVIVRTAAEGASEEELTADVERLKAQWEAIEKKAKQNTAPHQLYAEPDLTLRIIRDTFTEDFKHLFVAGNGGDNDVYESIKEYLDHVAPHLAERLVKWDDSQGDPFAKFRIDEQISKALERKVFLPSGGSLVIDRTEAMTVIDVNTGKFTGSGGNLEETVTRNNLEAAEEIVRQLRLRDLGGIIVVDFIDMVLPSNRELLLRRLVECLGRDRTRHQVSEVTSLGLVQMTRKRIGTGLAEAFTDECEQCGGRGYIRHDEPVDSQAPADGGERHGGKGSGNSNRRRSNNNKSKAAKQDEATQPKANQVQPSEEAKQAAARLAAAASRHHNGDQAAADEQAVDQLEGVDSASGHLDGEQPAEGKKPAADSVPTIAETDDQAATEPERRDGTGGASTGSEPTARQGELLPGKAAAQLEAARSETGEQVDANQAPTV